MSSKSGAKPAVLIIGAGMYVCGRGTDSFGTVLPTVVQSQARGSVGDIYLAATSPESVRAVRTKLDRINKRLGTHAQIKAYPKNGGGGLFAYRKALAEIPRPACALIVVPDHLHADIAADVISAGLHLLVVKPLAPTSAEARRLVDLVKARNVYGAVEFHKRFDEANLVLRQAIEDRRLGDLRYITVEYSQRRVIQTIFNSWLRHTNVFQYLGVHYVDLIHFMTGATPVRVLATGQPCDSVGQDLGALDAIEATIVWQQGDGKSFISLIVTNWIDPNASTAMSDQKITVVGTSGRCYSDQKHRGLQLVTDGSGVEDINPYFTQVYLDAVGDMDVRGYGPRSIEQFLRDVSNLVEGACSLGDLVSSRPSFQEALVSTAVVEAVGKSLLERERWVGMDEVGFQIECGSRPGGKKALA